MRPRSGQRASLSAEALVECGYSLVILAGPGGGQSLGCKLDECLDQRRNVSAARIHGIKPANRRRVVVENAAQPPVPDRRLGDLVGQLSDAVTCNRCGNHRLHFIGGEVTLVSRISPEPTSSDIRARKSRKGKDRCTYKRRYRSYRRDNNTQGPAF